jgi:hypothetical protein
MYGMVLWIALLSIFTRWCVPVTCNSRRCTVLGQGWTHGVPRYVNGFGTLSAVLSCTGMLMRVPGPTKKALSYFQHYELVCPPLVNPPGMQCLHIVTCDLIGDYRSGCVDCADFMMDVIGECVRARCAED